MGRNKVWLLPLLLLISFPLWKIPVASFLTPRGEYNPTNKPQQQREQQLTMKNAVLSQFSGAGQKSLLRAEVVRSGKKPKTFLLEKVSGEIYGDATTTISAKSGIYDQNRTTLTLNGNVVVEKKAKSQQLTSQQLIHNETADTLFSPGPATVISEGNTIKGGSLLYRISAKEYTFSKRVYTTLKPK